MDNNHETLIQNFIKYYYENISLKNITALSQLFREHSKYNIEGNIIYGDENIILKLSEIAQSNIKYNISTVDYVSSGDRRLNILVNGTITTNTFNTLYQSQHFTITKNFTEYIHLGMGNDKNYWIPSIILRTF